jgi:tRNA pseudouridine38-40 synthase
MDMGLVEREAETIVGTHDFAAFRSANDERENTVRTINGVEVRQNALDARRWSITIEGSAFLHNMVRILVGTLVDVGRGHSEAGVIGRALEQKKRSLAGQTAPAHGLFLERIDLDLPAEAGERWPQ